MKNFLIDLGFSSLVGSALGVIVLAIFVLSCNRIPPAWRHILLLVAVCRLAMLSPPACQFSWENNSQPKEKITAALATNSLPIVNTPLQINKQPSQPNQKAPIRPLVKPTTLYHWIFSVWLGGLLIMILWFGFSLLRVYKILRRSISPDADHRISNALRVLTEQVKLTNTPRLKLTNDLATPAITGLWRPTILFPINQAETLSISDIKMVLLHEIGHLKRFDILTNWTLLLLQAIHWFNPAVWYLVRRIQIEAEQATDAWVLSRLDEKENKLGYGKALLRLLEGAQTPSRKTKLTTLGVIEGSKQLSKRIKFISQFRRTSIFTATITPILVIGFAVTGLTQSPKMTPLEIDLVFTDDQGIPLADVEVTACLTRDKQIISLGKSNQNGEFKKVYHDNYIMFEAISKDRKWILQHSITSPPSAFSLTDRVVAMHRLIEVELKCVDQDGRPIRGLKFYGNLTSVRPSDPVGGILRELTTNAEGVATLALPAGAHVSLAHNNSSYTQPGQMLSIPVYGADRYKQSFTLKQAVTIKGRVLLPDGTPASFCTISNSSGEQIETNIKGRFTLKHCNIGPNTLQIRSFEYDSDDWYFNKLVTVEEGRDPYKIPTIKMSKAFPVQIKYIDKSTGQLVRKQTKFLERKDQKKIIPFTQPGYLSIYDNPPLVFEAGAYRTVRFEIEPDLALNKSINISVVDENNTPISGALVDFVVDNFAPQTKLTGTRGKLSLPSSNLNGRKVPFKVYAYHGERTSDEIVCDNFNQTLTLKLKNDLAPVTRAIIVDKNNRPVVNATMKIITDLHPTRLPNLTEAIIITKMSDKEGRLTFKNSLFRYNNYQISVNHPEHGAAIVFPQSTDISGSEASIYRIKLIPESQ